MPKQTYEQAYAELQQILQAIQEDKISIDELAEQTKRAAKLVAFCQKKLRETETQVDEMFTEF